MVPQIAVERLAETVKGAVHPRFSLAPLTSFKVGGEAGVLVEPMDPDDLLAIAAVIKDSHARSVVLGRGTNVLVADGGFDGIVVRLGASFEWIKGEGNLIEAGGATPLPQVANWAARRRLSGLEFAVAIPATVGGAVRMNAGAHGEAVSKILTKVTVCRLAGGSIDVLDQHALKMSYRETALGPSDVVCSATFHLEPGDESEITKTMAAHRRHRSDTQPSEGPNAGSVFRNPPSASAGELIESAGLKGTTLGAAQVSMTHANFIVAHPGATAQQIFDLVVKVQAEVLGKCGVRLLPEIKMIGEFEGQGRLETAP